MQVFKEKKFKGIELSKILRMRKEVPREWWVEIWEKFYFDVFKIKINLSLVEVADFEKGFNWVVYVYHGFALEKIFAPCCKPIPYTLLNYLEVSEAVFPYESRSPGVMGTYAIRFRNRVEADEELKNNSANDLINKKICANTLREALLLDLFYFWCTGKHTNLENPNLCAGSRDEYGNVPIISCRSTGGCIYYCSTDCSSEWKRSRQGIIVWNDFFNPEKYCLKAGSWGGHGF